MIYRLRKKFILITMASLLAVLIFLIGIVNLVNYYQIAYSADSKLEILAQYDGTFPELRRDESAFPDFRFDFSFRVTKETRYETRYFIVHLDEEKQISEIDSSHIASLSDEDIENYAMKTLAKKSTRISGYKDVYRYLIVDHDDGTTTMFFLDCRMLLEAANQFFMISIIVAFLSLFFVLVLVSMLSKRAIQPFVTSVERQKEFITNAGHEIKTPLTIIKANADVLKMTGGDSEWLDSIHNQTNRLDMLVKNLLALAKMEEAGAAGAYTQFSLSDLVQEMAGSFKPLAESKGSSLQLSLQPNLELLADKENIRQLVSILVDNAVKYSLPKSDITIDLSAKGKELLLKVSNQIKPTEQLDLERLFDRFYRADDSRNQAAGGYGIGLSIAQAIVKNHKGTIAANKKEDIICFVVTLPKK